MQKWPIFSKNGKENLNSLKKNSNFILFWIDRFFYHFYSTVEPGISKLFQEQKKFTIARCLLSKGFDQKSNMGSIISVLKSSQTRNNMPIQRYCVWIVLWLVKITLLKEHFFSKKRHLKGSSPILFKKTSKSWCFKNHNESKDLVALEMFHWKFLIATELNSRY